MDAAPTQHEELIGRFRADLEKLEPSEIIRKHITTGTPVAIAEEAYFDLRRIVAKEFDLHPVPAARVSVFLQKSVIARRGRTRISMLP
jgi:hypothetical protein